MHYIIENTFRSIIITRRQCIQIPLCQTVYNFMYITLALLSIEIFSSAEKQITQLKRHFPNFLPMDRN